MNLLLINQVKFFNILNMLKKKYICFDISKNNIGIAIGQNLTFTATPILSINKYKNILHIFKKIKEIILKWNPNKIIVGLPLNIDGSLQKNSLIAHKFYNLLNKNILIETELYDERLTTYKAKKLNYKNNYSIHSLAACIILEDWLNNNIK